MTDGRRAWLWDRIARRAAARDIPVSAADACEVAVMAAAADGGWLSVMSDPARRALVHATTPRAAELDELEFTLGEGPGTDAFESGRPVLVADLKAPGWQERWPGFTESAAKTAAVFSFPLVMGAIRLGVLGLYRLTPGSLSPRALADVLECADTSLRLLLDSRAEPDRGTEPWARDGWARDGWADDHARVYQATGMVSAQCETGLEEALSLLRAHAFGHGLTLDEAAAAVVGRRLRLDSGESSNPAA